MPAAAAGLASASLGAGHPALMTGSLACSPCCCAGDDGRDVGALQGGGAGGTPRLPGWRHALWLRCAWRRAITSAAAAPRCELANGRHEAAAALGVSLPAAGCCACAGVACTPCMPSACSPLRCASEPLHPHPHLPALPGCRSGGQPRARGAERDPHDEGGRHGRRED